MPYDFPKQWKRCVVKFVGICVWGCVCVCVCERETERETEKERECIWDYLGEMNPLEFHCKPELRISKMFK